MNDPRTLHDILWDGADHLSRRPGDDARPAVAVMGALMLTHAALEAYLNHVGALIAPDVWADEKSTFTSTPYRGVLGKLNWLGDKLGVARDWGARPWQSLQSLDTWRNRLAHGKNGADGEVPAELLSACTPEGLATCREAVREVCGVLHGAVMNKYQVDRHATAAPFAAPADD